MTTEPTPDLRTAAQNVVDRAYINLERKDKGLDPLPTRVSELESVLATPSEPDGAQVLETPCDDPRCGARPLYRRSHPGPHTPSEPDGAQGEEPNWRTAFGLGPGEEPAAPVAPDSPDPLRLGDAGIARLREQHANCKHFGRMGDDHWAVHRLLATLRSVSADSTAGLLRDIDRFDDGPYEMEYSSTGTYVRYADVLAALRSVSADSTAGDSA